MDIYQSIILEEYEKSKRIGETTEKLGEIWYMMAKKLADHPKHGFKDHLLHDDLISFALIILYAYGLKIVDSSNLFATYTQMIHDAFQELINREALQQQIQQT